MADADRPRAKPGGLAGGRGGAAWGKGGSDGQHRPLPSLPGNMKTPDNVHIGWSGLGGSTLGVWALEPIPAGTRFAPYQGEKVITMRKDSDPLCVWEIVDLETNEFLFYVDATRSDQACWLRYVQRARHLEEQNVLADQDGIDIIYTTMKPILKGEELLTWYKTPSTRRGQRQAGRESRGKAKSMKDMPSKAPLPKSTPPPSTASPKKKAVKVIQVSTPKDVSLARDINKLKQKEMEEREKQKEKMREEERARKEKERKEYERKEREIKEKEMREYEIREKQMREKELREKEIREKEIKEKEKREMREKEKREKDEKERALREKALKEKEMREKENKDREMKERKEQAIKEKEAKEREMKQKELKEKEKEREMKENAMKEKDMKERQEKERVDKEKKTAAANLATDLDLDRDSSDLEIDLDEDEEDEEEDDEDSDITDAADIKADGSKSTQSEDPEKFHFKLTKDHITKSRHGRKVFKCDICSGIYRHAFSLKRHYIRNHINLKYVSRGDILNCQINPDTHDLGAADDKDNVSEGQTVGQNQALSIGHGEELRNGAARLDSKTGSDGPLASSTPAKVCDTNLTSDAIIYKSIKQESTDKESCKLDGSVTSMVMVHSRDIKAESDLRVERMDTDHEQNIEPLSGLYRCNVCCSFFDTVALLKSHIENHPNLSSSKAFACDQCDMKFSHKQNLRRHLAVHTGEKPFLCKFCSKMFPTATNQKRHERIHLGRRVACDYCSSTFTQSGDLKKHIRKLHPESFHECAFCGKYYTDEVELIEHVSSHNESMQSNEAERHRRRQAFKVDMELDRVESMRLAEQKTPGVKFACTVCKKRFLDYANMCRHRRLAHQRHLLIGGHGSNSSSPVPSPTKLASDSSDGDPQAFFYANIANNISENLTNYIEGTKEHLEKSANQMKLKNKLMKDSPEKTYEAKPKVEADIVTYNFPAGFCLKQNYRKVVCDKDRMAFDKGKKIKAATKFADLKDTEKQSELNVKESDFSTSDKAKCVKVSEVRTVKVIEPKGGKVSKEEFETKPVISTVNGVSLNIPVFNLSNIAKREIKMQPVCTVQPIQRQIHSISEHKPEETPAPVQVKKAVSANNDKPSIPSMITKTTHVNLMNKLSMGSVNGTTPPPPTPPPPLPTPQQVTAVKLVTKPPPKPAGGKATVTSNKPTAAPAACLALKIPQVHVCSVCRRLFNNEILFRQHMMDKHKTTPEETNAQKEKEQKEKVCSENLDNSNPVMDLSGKKLPIVSKPVEKAVDKEKAIIEHDEGARLLLDFALGIRDEPEGSPCPAVESPSPADMPEHFPLDLSSNMSSSSGPGSSDSNGKVNKPQGKGLCVGGSLKSKPRTSAAPQVVAAHGGTRAPAAHSNQGKVQGLLRIPTYHPTNDLDLPAPLVSPPGTPRSPWLPSQLPSLLCGPFSKHSGRNGDGSGSGGGNSKKFICMVCYGEFPSRGSLHNHQRATHSNVRCDHVEVDTDVVAPWWQKPSPVGMLNVCSSQISEYDQADQQQFKCTKCNKAFGAVEELHTHIFECARVGKQLLKQSNKSKLSVSTVSSAAAGVKSAVALAEAEAAAAAAKGLRLLASSIPWRPTPREYHANSHLKSASVTVSFPSATTTVQDLKPSNPLSVTATAGTTTTTTVITSAISSTGTFGSFGPFGATKFGMNIGTANSTNPPSTNTTANTTTMLERFKNSILKKLKKKKKKRELEDGLGLMTKKRRRSLELLYNPLNHVRRREMTEVVDMQRCQGCGQRFTTISLLERHIPMCTEKERLKEIQIVRNPFETVVDSSESRNMCRYCNKQFTYLGMLRKHVFAVCQVRKTHVVQSKPLDASWEQELAQHYSGSALPDVCSNDGIHHADDAVSVANSTCSSHDTECGGQRSRPRKRKNRGWGNGKKKRYLSGKPLVSPGSVDDTANLEDDLDEDELEEDDLEDGNISDRNEIQKTDESKTGLYSSTYAESSQSGDDELQIVEDAPEEKDVNEINHVPTPPPAEIKLKTEPTVSSISSTNKDSPVETPKQQSFIGRHTLPFVLSIPQYRERTPLTPKPKSSKVMSTLSSSFTPTEKQNAVPAQTVEIVLGKQQLDLKNEVKETNPTEKWKPAVVVINPKLQVMAANACLTKTDTISKEVNSVSVPRQVTTVPLVQQKAVDAMKGPNVSNCPIQTIQVEKSLLVTAIGSVPIIKTNTSIPNSKIEIPLVAKSGVSVDTTKKTLTDNSKYGVSNGPIAQRADSAEFCCKVEKPPVLKSTIVDSRSSMIQKGIGCDSTAKLGGVAARKVDQTPEGKCSLLIINGDGNIKEVLEAKPVERSTILKKDSKGIFALGRLPMKAEFLTNTTEENTLAVKTDMKSNESLAKEKEENVTKASTSTSHAEHKSSTSTSDLEESSDEEDITEFINTVLAQRRQGQKQKAAKLKKQTKQELKSLSAIEKPKPDKSDIVTLLPGVSKAANKTTEKVLKQTKGKSELGNAGKPTKTKAKKKAQDSVASKIDLAVKKEKKGKKKMSAQHGQSMESISKKTNKAKKKIQVHDGESLISEIVINKYDKTKKKIQLKDGESIKLEPINKTDKSTKKNIVHSGESQLSDVIKTVENFQRLLPDLTPMDGSVISSIVTLLPEEKNTIASPLKKAKAKKAVENATKDPVKGCSSTKKKKILTGKKATKKPVEDATKPKGKTKKRKLTEQQTDDGSKKSNNKLDSPTKVQNKGKTKIATKKLESNGTQFDKKEAPRSPVRNAAIPTKATTIAVKNTSVAMKSTVTTVRKTASPVKTTASIKTASPVKTVANIKTASPVKTTANIKTASPVKTMANIKIASPVKTMANIKTASPVKTTTTIVRTTPITAKITSNTVRTAPPAVKNTTSTVKTTVTTVKTTGSTVKSGESIIKNATNTIRTIASVVRTSANMVKTTAGSVNVTVVPAKNRKRKVPTDGAPPQSSPCSKETNSNAAGGSPPKMMKTRGGAATVTNTIDSPKKRVVVSSPGIKTRRVSVRSTRPSLDQVANSKTKGRMVGQKSAPAKFKRSVSANLKAAPLEEKSTTKSHTIILSPSMRTRQSRLSL